jgi:hypothetical protein
MLHLSYAFVYGHSFLLFLNILIYVVFTRIEVGLILLFSPYFDKRIIPVLDHMFSPLAVESSGDVRPPKSICTNKFH